MTTLLLIPCGIILLVIAAYAWRSKTPPVKPDGRMRTGPRRDVWEEVEGRVTSIGLQGEAVFVRYEFLTSSGSHSSEQKFTLEVAEPYQFGDREADIAHASERYLRLYPIGGSVRVRFNPNNESESVLSRPRPQPAGAPAKLAESSAV